MKKIEKIILWKDLHSLANWAKWKVYDWEYDLYESIEILNIDWKHVLFIWTLHIDYDINLPLDKQSEKSLSYLYEFIKTYE